MHSRVCGGNKEINIKIIYVLNLIKSHLSIIFLEFLEKSEIPLIKNYGR